MDSYSIRNITKDDIYLIKNMRNEQIDVLRQTQPLTNEDQLNWYNNIILPSYKNKTKTLNFILEYNKKFIGYCGLVNIDYVNKKAEISFLVKTERKNNDKIYEQDFNFFLNYIKKYSFNNLNLNKLWTETYEFRDFHIYILEKNNFKKEGILKNQIINNGKYINSILHGFILNNENIKIQNNIDICNYYKNKIVLVTGGAGLIGLDLILNLCRLDIKKIICIDLKEKPDLLNNPKIDYIQNDINKLDLNFFTNFNINVVFHLAATFERTHETEEFWEDNFNNNVKLSNHIGTICKNLKNLERVVFTSSYLIYNSDLFTFNKPRKSPFIVDENTQVRPRNICGAAKLMHEIELDFLSKFQKYNFTCITPRIFRVYGPRECGKFGGTIINRWIDSLIHNERNPITVYGKEGIFDFIYSEEIAYGLVLLGSIKNSGVVNIGRGKHYKIDDVINILKKYFPNMKIIYKEIENFKYEACESNMTLFHSMCNWKPKIDLEEGIDKIIKYKLNNKI